MASLMQQRMRPSNGIIKNNSASYVLPRPLKRFKVWSTSIEDGVKSHEKILLILNDKISSTERIQVTIEVLQDSILRQKCAPDSVILVNEFLVEIALPELNGNGIKLSLEIGKDFQKKNYFISSYEILFFQVV